MEEAIVKAEITLTSRELLFISATIDAVELLGVSDAFFGMEDTEIQHEITRLQFSLEEKGYAEMDFDGGFTLYNEVREMVDICANCDIFIVVDKCKSKESQIRELYYAKTGNIVKLQEEAGINILTPVPTSYSLLEHISHGIDLKPSSSPLLKNVRVANKTLSEAKAKAYNFDRAESIRLLMGSGCDELSAKTILCGLTEESEYYSVVITVFGGEQEGIYSIMLSSSENGTYRLTPITGEEIDSVQFDVLDASDVKMAIADIIRSAFPPERGSLNG